MKPLSKVCKIIVKSCSNKKRRKKRVFGHSLIFKKKNYNNGVKQPSTFLKKVSTRKVSLVTVIWWSPISSFKVWNHVNQMVQNFKLWGKSFSSRTYFPIKKKLKLSKVSNFKKRKILFFFPNFERCSRILEIFKKLSPENLEWKTNSPIGSSF